VWDIKSYLTRFFLLLTVVVLHNNSCIVTYCDARPAAFQAGEHCHTAACTIVNPRASQ